MDPRLAQSVQTEKDAKTEGVVVDADLAAAIMSRRIVQTLISMEAWEGYAFAEHQINIKESHDLYGAVMWPSAIVLCYFLDTHRDTYNLLDKNVIELGAGTGLVSIVTSLLGAKVTSTDLPEVLSNLQFNVLRNTRGRCRHTPRVTELSWGQELEQRFPRATCLYDYVFAADVVYCHPHLVELLDTFDHLCQDGTEILWAMRFRLDRENRFVERFQGRFHLEELYDLPSLSIKLYRASRKEMRRKTDSENQPSHCREGRHT
ncbi:protein-lysine methyltransferase METTL21E [Coregonus clupeaformis]|uniref:protein-lysine methyltransferase METTL21E n=1 Tax=Coregonus clupeaformis TaxID=59861 RepID=UPI001E1C9944|nr:protein-lysine methyltransferase METTL21E [Coregonus clupeaformis]